MAPPDVRQPGLRPVEVRPFLFGGKVLSHVEETPDYYQERIAIELYLYGEDMPIAGMYPEIWEAEEVSAYVYRSE